MKTLLHCVLLVCLVVPCHYLSAQSLSPYDLKLADLEAHLASADELHKLVLLDQIFGLYDYVTDRGQAIRILDSIAHAPGETGIITREAAALSAVLKPAQTGVSARAQRWYENEVQRRQILAAATSFSARDDSEGFEILAQLESIAGLPGAAEHMEHAAQLSPTAERWQLAASYTSDPFRKFAALQAALALDPGNSRLILQLASYYIGRNQLEKARDLLLHTASAHSDDFVVRERLAGLYFSLGLRSQALYELRSLQRLWPDPLWMKMRLAVGYEQLGLREEAARLATSVIADDRNQLEMLELLARFHQVRHMVHALEADYAAILTAQPNSADVWRKLATAQIDLGDFEGARLSLLNLVKLNPRDPGAHRLLAETYRHLHMESEARQQLTAAEQSVSAAGTGFTAAGVLDAQFLADPQAIAASSFSIPLEPIDLALADIRVQELFSNGLDRVHVQQIFSIGSEAAIDAHRITSIRYSPSTEALRVLRARLWKRDGQVLEAQDLGDREPAETSGAMYHDARTRQLRFASIELGDMVEVEYTLAPLERSSPYGNYFGELVFFRGRSAAKLKRYVLVAPARQTIYTHAERVSPPEVLAQGNSSILIWEARNMAAVVREARAPGLSEIAPYVHVSTFSDWKQVGEWYAGLVRPQFTLDRALEEELSRLLEGKRNDKEKIAAIQEFVLRSTRYVAQEFGIYSYKPYPVAQTYARRFGDCKDKASLMIALLNAAGVRAQIALLRTRSLGDVAAQPASVAIFDHAIVYIPKYDLWLDGTAEYALRDLPLEDQGALAFTVSLDGTAELRRTPMSRANDNFTRHVIQAQLTPQGMIRFSGSTIARGEDAPGLRQELAIGDQQLDSFRRDMAQVFPSVQVYSVQVHDQNWAAGGTKDGEISVDFRGGLDSFHQKRAVSLQTSWIPRSYVATLAPSGNRLQDLLLFAPWTTEEEIHIALPAGARVTDVPRDQAFATPFGSLKLRCRKSSREIVIQSHVQFDKDRVGVGDYPAFRQFCLQVERSFHDELKVELPQ
jgi:cellulose synthase operon protein C